MGSAARSTTWPEGPEIPVLDHDDDLGFEPTVRSEFVSFGQVTLEMSAPVPPLVHVPGSAVKPYPRVVTPTPFPRVDAAQPMQPGARPPPARGMALGFAIGATLGLSILAVWWNFFV